MAVAGAFAGPEETFVVLEEVQIVADVDPVLIFFREQRGGFSRGRVGEKEFEDILIAIEALDGEAARSRGAN